MMHVRCKFNKTLSLILFFLFLCASFFAHAEEPAADSAKIRLFFDESQPLQVVNSEASVSFIFEIPDDFHLYKETIQVELDSANVTSNMTLPEGEPFFDELRNEDVETYQGQVQVVLNLLFTNNFDFSQKMTGTLFYQACAQKICQRMTEIPFSFVLVPDAATLANIKKTEPHFFQKMRSALAQNDVASVLGHGVLFALLIVFVAGILTSLTPCLLPIIPLTLAFIGVTPLEKKSKRLLHLLIFSLGMDVMYATLGVVSALIGQGLGFIYQSQIFIAFLVLFFVLMSLWMFGILHWPVFSRIQTAVARHQPQGRFKYFYAGLTVGVFAAPCVVPVVGPLLFYISTTHDVVLGFVLMLAYAQGLSLLFVLFSFASNQWIAKSGERTRWVKNILGTLLLLVAIFYLQILVKPWLSPHIQHDPYFLYDFEQAKITAQGQSKGMIVDFYADWCISCHELEREIWSKDAVRQSVSQSFVPVKIDCTDDNEQCRALEEVYNVQGLPTILFLDKAGQEVNKSRILGAGISAEEFVKRVKRYAQ